MDLLSATRPELAGALKAEVLTRGYKPRANREELGPYGAQQMAPTRKCRGHSTATRTSVDGDFVLLTLEIFLVVLNHNREGGRSIRYLVGAEPRRVLNCFRGALDDLE